MEDRFEYVKREQEYSNIKMEDIDVFYVGDIVEQQHDWSRFDQPIGKLSIVTHVEEDGNPCITDSRGDHMAYASSYFKVVETKPLETAVEGDIIILVNISDKDYYTSKVGDLMEFDYFDCGGFPCGPSVAHKNGGRKSWKPQDVKVLQRKIIVSKEYDAAVLADVAAKGANYAAKMESLYEAKSVHDAVCASNVGVLSYVPHELALSSEIEDRFQEMHNEISENLAKKLAEHRDAMMDAMIFGTGILYDNKRVKPKDIQLTATQLELMERINDDKINRIVMMHGRSVGKSLTQKLLYDLMKAQQAEKEKTMPHEIKINVDGKEINISECCEDMAEEVQTDLETAPKWITLWYDLDGQAVMQELGMSPKQARKALSSDPDLIGFTFRSYQVADSGTTNIPLKKLNV